MELHKETVREVTDMNHRVDQLLEMANQKMTWPTVEENHKVHQAIGQALYTWRSEKLVKIHPSEVDRLTAYQYHLLDVMDKQRTEQALQAIQEGFQVETELPQRQETRARMGLPPISFEGFKK